MRIEAVTVRRETLPLSRPYAITGRYISEACIVVVELATDAGHVGLGSAAPARAVTGESFESCAVALEGSAAELLVGRDARELEALERDLVEALPGNPAARAALDMALHDVLARDAGLPLVEMLGRAHEALPTSVTIGILPEAETLAEAREHLSAGFRVLKIKLGGPVEEDLERLRALRAAVGARVTLRVDANRAWDVEGTRRFLTGASALDLELVEQPTPVGELERLADLPGKQRARIAADESLLDAHDAERLAAARACGIFNIKLMKCGGLLAARRIAAVAEPAGIALMWGCNDESVLGIAAALHVALACPATRYLDLDGHLDLARDVAAGGLVLENGLLGVTDAPGLGARLAG